MSRSSPEYAAARTTISMGILMSATAGAYAAMLSAEGHWREAVAVLAMGAFPLVFGAIAFIVVPFESAVNARPGRFKAPCLPGNRCSECKAATRSAARIFLAVCLMVTPWAWVEGRESFSPPPTPLPSPVRPLDAWQTDGVGVAPPEVWGLDSADARAELAARGVPVKEQRRPPCAVLEVELHGACWLRIALAPPCGRDFEFAGGCYTPALVD